MPSARSAAPPGTPAALALLALLAAAGGAGATQWEDATAAAGIAFRLAGELHAGHQADWPGFPEIMGGGACWLDADGDGFDDLYLVNQIFDSANPGWGPWAAAADPRNHLYLNRGDGTFEEVGEAAGVASRAFGYGCSAADYDGDGHVDLFVSNFGASELFRNRGDGTFENVTASSGLAAITDCGSFRCMSTSSAWADHDLDGDLDLFVGNYVDTYLGDVLRGPRSHVAQPNWLLRNEGDGTFEEVAAQAGVRGRVQDLNGSKTLGVAWFDADLDGDPDLYVANDEEPNEFYVNLGDGTFEERAEAAGIHDPRAGMGLAVGDYDNDGFFDLFMTHYAYEDNGFYRNRGDLTFEQRSGEDDLANSVRYVGWGTRFADVDHDRDLDIVIVNGHTEWQLPDYNQTRQVFLQSPGGPGAAPGDVLWTEATNTSGPGITAESVGRGMAMADYDLDGDLDMAVVSNANQTAELLRASGAEGRWLQLQLRQPGLNRHAIGARVTVEAGGVAQHLEVRTGLSYLSQHGLALHVGLGDAAQADRVVVRWPGGGESVLEDLPADRVVRIARGAGDAAAAITDTLAPRTRLAPAGLEGPGGWWRSEVGASLVAEDRAVGPASGVAWTEVDLGHGWISAASAPLLFEADGVHTLMARSGDHAGNVEPPRSLEVRIDRTPPTAPSIALDGPRGDAGWFTGPATVTLGGAEDALSGVHTLAWRLDDGPWRAYAGPFVVAADGAHRIEAAAVDRAGNQGPSAFAEARVDATPPSVALANPRAGWLHLGGEPALALGTAEAVVVATPDLPGLAGAALQVRASSGDAASGVARVVLRLDGAPVAALRAGDDAWAWEVGAAAPGQHRLEVEATDHAGNRASTRVEVLLAPATAEGLAAAAPPGLLPLGSLLAPGAAALAAARRSGRCRR